RFLAMTRSVCRRARGRMAARNLRTLAHTRAQLRTTSRQLLRTYSNSYEAKRIGLIRAALASLTRQHLA
ncbi:hypothetical protein ACQCRO_18705, partial [Ralstonia pseudosolanacearum]